MKIIETFAYVEDNRRSARPVIEHLFHFELNELESTLKAGDGLVDRLQERFHELHIPYSDAMPLLSGSEAGAREVISQLFTGTALILQRGSGHRLGFRGYMVERNAQRIRTFFEYEEQHTGERAANLALLLLGRILPDLELDALVSDEIKPLVECLAEFREMACKNVLPLDAEVMIEAARRADIPCFKLDREPFTREPDELRIRPNSALRLGQACRQHIVDGNFCVDRCAQFRPYLEDRRRIAQLLRELDLPVPRNDGEFTNCSSVSRARRSALRIGYPVVMKSAQRITGAAVVTAIGDENQLNQAYKKVGVFGRKVYLEQYVVGDIFKIVVAGGKVIGITRLLREPHGNYDVTHIAHPSLIERVNAVAADLNAGMFVLTLVSEDLSLPLGDTQSHFVDIELAPALDSFLPAGFCLMAKAAEHFLAWLFPDGNDARIPVVAVTGTNGKTTTSRLILQIARSAGFVSGLACSDGVYVNDNLIYKGDLAGWVGHFLTLGVRDVEFAVLETARGAVAKHGISFDKCDVAICTNVTEDHLEDAGIETLEQMADLKCSILKRARNGVVLNADDPRCVDMILQLPGIPIFLVSTRLSLESLREVYGHHYGFCCLGIIDGESWLILYEKEEITPIAPVNLLPFTLGGKAEYNISNALHACAACHLTGMGIAVIGQALSEFEMNFGSTPGRLNFHEGRSFSVLLDYAHNPAGIAAFVKLVDQLEVTGHKIVAFSAASYNPRSIVAANAHAVAGHFDKYICYNFGSNIERDDLWVPAELKQSLIGSGVPEHNIVIADDGLLAVREVDRVAGDGDMVVFLSGHSNRAEIWGQLTRTVEQLTQ